MKDTDLITIFPGIYLETTKWDNGKEVADPEACDDIKIGNARVLSYKKLQDNPNQFDKIHIDRIKEISPSLIEYTGKPIDNFTIIIEPNLEIPSLVHIPNPDSQQILTYCAYEQHVDYRANFDFIKIICFQGGGRHFLLNNEDVLWGSGNLYMLPPERGRGGLRLKRSVPLTESLVRMSVKEPKQYKRMITAISLFNESCNINNVGPKSAIVLLVSALESLLGIPRSGGKKKMFAYGVKTFWGFDETVEEWALKLYDLRSNIVHGEVVDDKKLMTSEESSYPNFNIVRDIFINTLLYILESWQYITLNPEYKSEKITELKNRVVLNKVKVEKILERKTNFTYKKIAEDKKLYKELVLRIERLTSTDYSAKSLIIKLIEVIFSIAEDWIKSDIEEPKSNTNDYAREATRKYNELLTCIASIKAIKTSSLENNLKLGGELRKLNKVIYEWHPQWPSKEKINFSVIEFLDRCSRALFGTF